MSTTQSQPQSRPRLPIHIHHSTSSSCIPSATSTLVEALESDPTTTYMLNHLPPSARLAALQKLFTLSNNAAITVGGELWSASTTPPETSSESDFQAAAAMFPPGKSLDNLGATALPGLLWSGSLAPALWSIGLGRLRERMESYGAATMPAKKATFKEGEGYFYIQLIGASTVHRGKGLAPALIKKLQERAEKEGKPIYLEASNEGARKVYVKLGFTDVGEVIRLGKSECDAEGERAQDDEAVGVAMWPMVWWPQGYARDAKRE